MKKIIITIVLAILLTASMSWAAAVGTCTQSFAEVYSASGPTPIATLTFTCTASADDGSFPLTATSQTITDQIAGRYLYLVTAYPTAGGIAPDAADVFIMDADGEDFLGSVDGGTTANKGLSLIHATLKKTTFPYSAHSSVYYEAPVTSALTLKILNQATVSANVTIQLKFKR